MGVLRMHAIGMPCGALLHRRFISLHDKSPPAGLSRDPRYRLVHKRTGGESRVLVSLAVEKTANVDASSAFLQHARAARVGIWDHKAWRTTVCRLRSA